MSLTTRNILLDVALLASFLRDSPARVTVPTFLGSAAATFALGSLLPAPLALRWGGSAASIPIEGRGPKIEKGVGASPTWGRRNVLGSRQASTLPFPI